MNGLPNSNLYDLAGNQVQQTPQPNYQPEALNQLEINLTPKKSSRIKIVGILVGVFLIAAAVGGYFIFQPDLGFFDSNAPANLTYWGLGEPESVVQPLLDQYHAAHPNITITYQQQSPTQYQQTLLTRLSQGTGPDIFRFHNTWVPVLKSELAPVTNQAYNNSSYESTFYPTTKRDLYQNGQYYGIPLMYDGLVMVYNADMLQAAGFSKPPETWSDVRFVYVPKLTVHNTDGTIAVSGMALGTANNVDYFSDILGLLMLQNGVTMSSGNQVTFDKSTSGGRNSGADAVDFYTLFAKKDFSVDKGAAWDTTLPPSSQAFASGKVAMILIPESKISEVSSLVSKSGHSFLMKVSPVPQAQAISQATPVNWATYWVEGVSKRSKNQKAAWDFLKFLSSKESEMKLYQSEVKLRGVGETPSRIDAAKDLTTDSISGSLISEAPTGFSWFMTNGTLDQNIDDAITGIFANVINNVLTKNLPTNEALSSAATASTQVLAQYGVVQSSSATTVTQP